MHLPFLSLRFVFKELQEFGTQFLHLPSLPLSLSLSQFYFHGAERHSFVSSFGHAAVGKFHPRLCKRMAEVRALVGGKEIVDSFSSMIRATKDIRPAG